MNPARRLGGCVCVLMFAALQSACGSRPPQQIAPPPPHQPPKADLHEAAKINADLSIQYLNEGQTEMALEKAKKALQQDPENPTAHQAIALVYQRRSDFDQAEKQYREAVSLAPNDSELKDTVGVFLCQQNKTADGLRYLQAAAEDLSYARPAAAWTNAGICARTAHAPDGGEKFFQNALQSDPDYPDALVQMARINYERSDFPRARAFLKRYERVGPPTAETLLLAANSERALGNLSAARSYEMKLYEKFPESQQTAQSLKANRP